MRIDEIGEKLRGALEDWARPLKGNVSVARDPIDVLSLLVTGPRGFILVLHYAGGTLRSDIAADESSGTDAETVNAVGDERFEIAIGQAMGLSAGKDMNIFAAIADRPALMRRVNDLRARVTALLFPDDGSTLRRFRWTGTDPLMLPDGTPLAAYKLTFVITAVSDVENAPIVVE